MGLASNDTFNSVVPAEPLTRQEQEHKELKGQCCVASRGAETRSGVWGGGRGQYPQGLAGRGGHLRAGTTEGLYLEWAVQMYLHYG